MPKRGNNWQRRVGCGARIQRDGRNGRPVAGNSCRANPWSLGWRIRCVWSSSGLTPLRPQPKPVSVFKSGVSGCRPRRVIWRPFDRFRRRVMFPIANDSGKIVAFGGRALGDDLPKYLNSPETPIYSKSNVLYHLDRAKEALRQSDFAVLVEGYMDAIAVARAGISNVVASCGTSLTEPQVKLLSRFTRRVVVNYDRSEEHTSELQSLRHLVCRL